MKIRKALRNIAIDLDERWDKQRLKLLKATGLLGQLQILCYRGIGRSDRILLKGRVLVDNGTTEYEDDDRTWDDLVNMYRRLHTTEIPNARVRVSAEGAETEAVTDSEGYFQCELEAVEGRPFSGPRQAIDLELLEPSGDVPVVARAEATIRSPDASFLIISDIDDTVVETEATNLLAMARATFLGNASTRTPFAGISELYHALVGGASGKDDNPLVFISRSPWNLYDLFDQFCDLQKIPEGRALCLRDWGFSLEGLTRARTRGHKFGIIQKMLQFEPDLPVILIGDSGQKDPEIYQAISEEFPGRVLGAFIRNVTRTPLRKASVQALAAEVEADGAKLYLSKDSLDVAERAAEHGWIQAEAVARVAAGVEVSRREPDVLDELIAKV